MKLTIDLKHIGPKAQVRQLIEELGSRLEERLRHFPREAVSLHVLFEENGSRTVYRTSLSCHVPRHLLAAHKENREAGPSIRGVFAELEHQLEKLNTKLRREHSHKRAAQSPKIF